MSSVSQNPLGSAVHRLSHTPRDGRARLRRLATLLVTGLLLAQAVPVFGVTVTAVANTGTWSGSGPGTTIDVHDGSGGLAQFDYSLNPAGYGPQAWTFKTTATGSGTVPLAWRLTGFHAWFQVRVGLDAFVKHGSDPAVYTSLIAEGPADCCGGAPSGGFDYANIASLTVQTGDEFGFRVTGSNGDSNNILQGSLKVGLNVVANGGFEQPVVANTATFDTYPSGSSQLTGWSVTAGSIDHIGDYWNAAEGAQSIDLDGSAAGTIKQTIATVPGQAYRVSFQYSANGDRPAGQPKPEMRVKAAGTSLGTFEHGFAAANPNINWTDGEASFVATGPSTELAFVSDDAPGSPWGIALDAVTAMPDLSDQAPPPGFSFGSDYPGSTDAAPLILLPGDSQDVEVPVALTNGATSVPVGVTAIVPPEGVTATTDGVATAVSTVTISAAQDAGPGNYTVTVGGAIGAVSDTATIYVTVLALEMVGEPAITNAYHAPGAETTLYAGRITADPDTAYEITFASSEACPADSRTDFGSILVTTDENGNAFFNSTDDGPIDGMPAAGDRFISAHVTGPGAQVSGFSPCVVNSPDNTTWPNALDITADDTPEVGTTIDQQGVGRWFKVDVAPGGSVTVDLAGLTRDYDVYLFTDIAKTYQALTTEQDLTKLSAEFAGSGFSGSGFSGSGFSGSGFSGSGFSGSGFSGSGFSGSGFSADSYSGSGFSGSGFSGSGFSGSGFSGSGFSGSGFSGSGFSGSGFSGSGFSAESFSAAQVYSLIGWSNNAGTASERVAANTWTSTGDFYIRVNGKNGVYDLQHPFTLDVSVNGSVCTGVNPIGSAPATVANAYDSVILTDTSRFGAAATAAMMAKLGQLGASTNGVVVDLASSSRVHDLQAQADANPGCVYAKNLVADAAKDVIDAYRKGNAGNVRYVVLAGGDNVLPFFRYPDTSSIGPEVNYFPPVASDSASEGSLRSNYTLGQDEYGSSSSITIGVVDFPIPDLAVGRLVESPDEIAGMAQAYLDQSVVRPGTSLVTGYDFIEDAANAIKVNLDAGTGETGGGQSLIDPYGESPEDGWTAAELSAKLLGGRRNDITFLGGHFSANSALAADFATVLTTDDLASSATDFKNSIIVSIGCHSGYNIVDADGIPNVTRVLDWPQALARKQATAILGTGYQYGDTDFIEYSERIYTELSRQLRYGSGPVAIGDALMAAKLEYLRQTPALGDLHDKALIESALYGLPMLGVDMPAGRLARPGGGATVTLDGATSEPGLTTGLRFSDLHQETPSTASGKTLNVQGGGTLPGTYYTGPGGSALSTPGAPILPLYAAGVTPGAGNAGYVLRGIGFLGGRFTDSSVTPVTGAPGTELQTSHTSFGSPTFYPTQMWTANYFDALSGGGGTTLFTTPAQHRAPNPGSDVVTLRLYQDLDLRLFYSASTAAGARSAAPVIYGISSDLESGGDTRIQATVVGDPDADVQQVWVTYTEPGSGRWGSFDLTRNGSNPTLWAGARALEEGTQFFVQAVNGFGLVSQNDNSGSYYQAGAPASTTASSSISLGGDSSGTYGETASVSATLTGPGTAAKADKLVIITLGSVTRSATTNASGQVLVDIPLSAAAGDYPLSATFLGDAGHAPAAVTASFKIKKATPNVGVACPATPVVPTGAPLTPCTATMTGLNGFSQPLAVGYTSNTAPGTATATTEFYGDAAYKSAAASATFVIQKLAQAITFNPVPASKFLGDADFQVSASASSSLPVTLTGAGACSVAGATVHLTGIGTCTVTATQGGNVSYAAAPPASVAIGVTWPFNGFLWPVANPPTVNIARAGGWVPLRFDLGGDRGMNIIVGGAPRVVQVACPAGAPTGDVDQAGTFKVGLSYVKLTGRYLYGWKVPASYKNGCYRLELPLVDGSTHVANFKFK